MKGDVDFHLFASAPPHHTLAMLVLEVLLLSSLKGPRPASSNFYSGHEQPEPTTERQPPSVPRPPGILIYL